MSPPAVVQGGQKPANTNAGRPHPRKTPPGAGAGGRAAKPAGRNHGQRASQRDQLEVEHIEHLHLIEAFIGGAAAYVMRQGFDSPEEWPALIQRTDGSRVQAPEAVVDQAVELIAGLCSALDTEIRAALKLPADAPRRKYRVLPRRSKDDVDDELWQSPDERATDVAVATSAAPGVPMTRPTPTKHP